MTFKSLTDQIFVSGQIDADMIRQAATDGIKVIINNRPDGEMLGQPKSEELESLAQELGITYYYLPVVPGQMDMETVAAFGKALDNADGPVLAFCRSGMRSASVWALSQAGKMPASEILEKAGQAGYNLSGLAGYLENQ